ncbi:phage head closure protein [Eisenbergiella tayi]|uniref:Phage head closure protein n=1 Tax=Eisenbergiella porci TaxID=2652274 RepID=A0A6N7WPI7_9FIRM|nr:phage head closure protein [Eisenbergiella porci]MSS91368.1 phage head closure protein [Eisenbergiella porci]
MSGGGGRGINPGRLKKRITIMRYQDTENSLGNLVSQLLPYKTVYAEIRPVRGKEYQEYYKDTNSLEYKITIRFLPDLQPADVLVYHEKQFLINSIINVEEQGYIQEIMCTEKLQDKKAEVIAGGS